MNVVRTRSLLFVPLLAALFAGGASAALAGCKKATADAPPPAEAPPVAVQTMAVNEVEVPAVLRLTGTLKGDKETDLAANVAGRVTSTTVERGAEVTPAQTLVQVDVRSAALAASEAKAQAASVQAQQAQAEGECARYQKLKEKGAITDLEFDRVAVQCRTLPLSAQAASARASMAAQNVGDGTIRAPFSGVVTERYVEVGEYVRPDSRVVTVVQIDPLRLELAVPEADAGKVRVGSDVRFRVAAYPDKTFAGKVRFVSGAIRTSTRDLAVEAIVSNAERTLRPGMFADVQLITGMRKLPGVPRAATFESGGNVRAFFVTDGRLQERTLAVAGESGDMLGVLKGSQVGDKVALGDLKTLANGQRVR